MIPIVPARVAAIHVGGRPATVAAGRSFEVVATPVDRWGSPLPGRRVRWSSSDARVAVATAEGRVRAVQPGSVVLTASCEGVSESVRVSVAAEPASDPATTTEPAAAQPRRIKLRNTRRRTRERILAAVLGFTLAGGALWYHERSRPQRAPLSTRRPPFPRRCPIPFRIRTFARWTRQRPPRSPPRARLLVFGGASRLYPSLPRLRQPRATRSPLPIAPSPRRRRPIRLPPTGVGGTRIRGESGPGPISSDVDTAPIVPAPASRHGSG